MAILRKKICLLFILTLSCFCLNADQSMVIIDKSGSMRGFSQTGELKRVYHSINDALKKTKEFSNIHLYAFDENGIVPYKKFEEIKYYGDTLIDKAIKDALKKRSDLITILTDNIQDPGGKNPNSDVTKFYTLLKRNLVEWVFIFPLSLDFDGWTYHNPEWKGKRAAIIYILLLRKNTPTGEEKEKREQVFLNTVDNISNSLNSPLIRCKPLETGVKMNFKKIEKINRNINVTPKEVNISFEDFTSTPSFILRLVLTSKYSNIAVNKGKLEGAAIGRIRQEGLFKDIKSSNIEILAQPPEATLPPQTVDDRYKIVTNIQNLNYKKDLISLLRMPFSKNGIISGVMSIEMKIPHQNLQLRSDILEKYSTTTRSDPGRIFGLNQLVPLLTEGKEVMINKSIKFNVLMPYPGWPGVLLFALLLVIIILPFVAVKFFKASCNRFILIINGQEQAEVKFFPFLWTHLHSPEYGAICKVKFKGNTMNVQLLPGYNWGDEDCGDTPLRSFGRNDSFSLSDDEGESLFIELSPIEKKTYEKDQEEVYDEENTELF